LHICSLNFYINVVPKPEESTDMASTSGTNDEKTIPTQGNTTRNTRGSSGYQNNPTSNYNRSNNGMQRQVCTIVLAHCHIFSFYITTLPQQVSIS